MVLRELQTVEEDSVSLSEDSSSAEIEPAACSDVMYTLGLRPADRAGTTVTLGPALALWGGGGGAAFFCDHKGEAAAAAFCGLGDFIP